MSDSRGVLASGQVIRDRVVRIIRERGHSLKDIEFYVHGTSTNECSGQPAELQHDGHLNLFMAVDMELVKTFAARKVSKLGGKVCGILLVLEKETDHWLEENGLLHTKEIDDMVGKIEHVFDPASAPMINHRGQWVYLPPDIFE